MPDDQTAELRRLAKTVTAEDRVRLDPPADLWARISEGIEDTDGVTHASLDALETSHETTDEVRPATEPPSPIDLTQQRLRRAPVARRRQHRFLAVAAAATIVAGVIGYSLVDGDDPVRLAEAVVTNTDLPEPYTGTATAVAELAGDEQRLIIDFDAALPADVPIELWLIKADLSAMTSLGLIEDVDGYVIPAGIDVAEYSVVDLSIEPDDGDPTHSGRSILRGTLTST